MTASATGAGFTDAEWVVWEPLIEAMRPRGKTRPHELRPTIAAVFWRHRNGARWRAIPAEFGPWWRAAQLFIRWAQHGAWERLLGLAQERAGGLALSLAFLDGTPALPGLHLRASQPGRAAVGQAERMAGGGDPLRED